MLAEGRGSFILLFILLFNPHESQSMDGCELDWAEWRCNDVCIRFDDICRCGGETFGIDDLKWCCNNVALNLSESCEGRCNYYPNDNGRNGLVPRAFVPLICGGNKTTCVQEGEGGNYYGDYKPTICTGNSSCNVELTWCRGQERKEEKCPKQSHWSDDRIRCPGIRSKKKAGNSTKSIFGQCVEPTKLAD